MVSSVDIFGAESANQHRNNHAFQASGLCEDRLTPKSTEPPTEVEGSVSQH